MHETQLTFGPLLTLRDVASELDVNIATVRRAIQRGDLPAIRIGQRGLRVARTDLIAYLAERRVRS